VFWFDLKIKTNAVKPHLLSEENGRNKNEGERKQKKNTKKISKPG
jgi:hypothetical protein